MLEYEMKWLGLPSLIGSMASYEGRLMKREKCNLIVDRDYYSRAKPSDAQMRWRRVPQRVLVGLIEREGLRISIKDYVIQNSLLVAHSRGIS
jgi:hypothetical protein